MTTPGKREREQKRDSKQKEKERRRREKRFVPRQRPEFTTAAEINGFLPSVESAMEMLHTREQLDRSAAPIPAKLFVGSLSDLTTSARLRAHFEPHGAVAEAVVITNRETGLTRNFGFVTVWDRKDSQRVIAATNRSELDGHLIVVNVATER